MDSIIPLGQKNTLAEYMILSGADNLENDPLIWPTVEENEVTRTKKYVELSAAEKIQADCDMKETNIILQGDDPIACLNKAMAFITAVASLRFPSTNNQLKTSSNPGNHDTIQDGRVRVVKCYNYQGEGHMAWQCTQPKRPRNATWYKDKAILAEAQEAGQILDEEQLAFLADQGVPDGQAVQTIILHNAAFRLRILILMILTVMMSRMQKQLTQHIQHEHDHFKEFQRTRDVAPEDADSSS
nr:hypothetical protein [Tanacetum cinerariifolium]